MMASDNTTPLPRGTASTKSIGAILGIIIAFLTIWNTLDGRIGDLRAEYKADASAHMAGNQRLLDDIDDLGYKLIELEKNAQEFNVLKCEIKNIQKDVNEGREERHSTEQDIKELFKATAKIDGTLTTQESRD